MNKLYDNTKDLIQICEALEGVKNYLKKSPYRTGAMAASLATSAAMLKTGVYTKTSANNLTGGGIANALIKAKANTDIPGSTSVTNAIATGIKKITGGNVNTVDTMGISWLPMAAGLTAFGIYKLVKYFKSIKYKEAKVKKLQAYLQKLRQAKVDSAKIQKVQKQIQNLTIDINAQKTVLRKQKQESMKQIQSASQIENSKKGPEKNQDKLQEINQSKQVLGKIV